MERRLLLDVVVGERAAVLELLAREDEALLIRRNALLVLDLRLHVVNRVGRLDLEGDGLAGEGLHENLHDYLFLRIGKCVRGWVVRAGEDRALECRRSLSHTFRVSLIEVTWRSLVQVHTCTGGNRSAVRLCLGGAARRVRAHASD